MIHTHQALWEAVATGLRVRSCPASRPWFNRQARVITARRKSCVRTRGAPLLRRAILANTGFAAISAEIEREWRALGVAARGGSSAWPAASMPQDFHPGASSVEADLLPRPRVIFTGRLHPQKNLPLLLEAWAEVVRRRPTPT